MAIDFEPIEKKSNIDFQPLEGENPNLIDRPLETLARSGGEFAKNIFSVIAHPIDTLKSIGNLGLGILEKTSPAVQISKISGAIPKELPQEELAEKVGEFYKDRFGSLENAKKTILEDPVGAASDLSLFLGGGGAALKATQVPKLAKAGAVASKVSRAVEPVGAVAKGIGKGLSKVTKGKKIAPFGKKVDPSVVEASGRVGVDLPASAKTTSRAIPQAEALVAKGFFGQKIIDKIDNAKVELSKFADDAISKTGKAEDMTSAGKAIFEGSDRYRNKFFEIKNELYNKATIPSKDVVRGGNLLLPETGVTPVVRVIPNKSKDFLNKIIADKRRAAGVIGKADDIKFFQTFKSRLSKKVDVPDYMKPFDKIASKFDTLDEFIEANGVAYELTDEIFLRQVYNKVNSTRLTARELQSGIRELNNKINNFNDPVATGNKAQLKKMVTLMSEDLDNALIKQRPDLAEAIEKANQFYMDGIDKLNSGYGKKIFDLADNGQYDKILPSIINKGTSVEDIPKIFEIVGADNVPQLQTAFLEDFLKGAKNADNTFTPLGVTKQINRLGGDNKLKSILNPEQYKAVKDIETISKSFGKLDRISQGSQTAFLGRVFGEMGLLFNNPWVGMKVFAGDVALSKFLSSDVGQRLLTGGIELTGRTGQRIAERGSKVGERATAVRALGLLREQGE